MKSERVKRERETEKKRCAQACHNLVMSHATNCKNETRALNLASDGAAESSQMLGVVTLTLA